MHTLGEFDVIYADPPWSYSEVPYFKKSLAVQYQYPTLTLPELLKLDVKSLAAKNAWLFMWCVNAQIPHGLKVMEAWGFKYRTMAFAWAKKTVNGKNAKTYGRCCTMQSVELCLVGKRGAPKRYAENVEQIIEAVKPRGHSSKPDEVYGRIEEIVGPEARKVELFARQTWPGWTSIGNAMDGKDIRDVIGVINDTGNAVQV